MPRSGSNSHDQWGSYSGFTSENAIPSRPPAPLYDADFIRDQPQELPFPVKQTFRGKTATVARSATPALIVPTKRASSGKTVGRSNVGQHAHSPVEDPKYLHSEDYPFGGGQPDRESENLLGQHTQLLANRDDVPMINAESSKLFDLPTSDMLMSNLKGLDAELSRKHFDAISNSVMSHEQLHQCILMQDEKPTDTIDLCGLVNAPGVNNDLTQRCQMAFTSHNRLIFTQSNHSVEVGLPEMRGLIVRYCWFHEKWSTREWSSYYASVKASEVVQVFVQQTFTSSYHIPKWNCQYLSSIFSCVMGGKLRSNKDISGVTQTLGDYDPESCIKRWDKTRFMKHSLVIRYVDSTTNSISQTVALAHPGTPSFKLYEMARRIEANIAQARLAKFLTEPTVFENDNRILTPLSNRASYKVLLGVLLVIGLFSLINNIGLALVMILSVLFAFGGSFAKANNSGSGTANGITKTLLAIQGGALVTYSVAFISLVY